MYLSCSTNTCFHIFVFFLFHFISHSHSHSLSHIHNRLLSIHVTGLHMCAIFRAASFHCHPFCAHRTLCKKQQKSSFFDERRLINQIKICKRFMIGVNDLEWYSVCWNCVSIWFIYSAHSDNFIVYVCISQPPVSQLCDLDFPQSHASYAFVCAVSFVFNFLSSIKCQTQFYSHIHCIQSSCVQLSKQVKSHLIKEIRAGKKQQHQF